jgi:hypothetical protein
VQRDGLECGEEGRDSSAWEAAVERGGGRAGTERGVRERLRGEVYADVCWDRVDSAGGHDDRVRFCGEVIKPKKKNCAREVEWGEDGRVHYIKNADWKNISLLDYVENPWCLPGDIDVVYTVPCACAGSIFDLHQQRDRHDALHFDLPHDWRTVVPKRTNAVEDNLGLLDGTLDGSLIEDIKLEYFDRIVEWQADGEKLGARARG